jgi:hypothetical protein
MFEAVLGVLVKGRGPLVIVVAADAADGLVFFLEIAVAVRHGDCLGFAPCSVSFLGLSAGAAACAEWILGRDCIFGRFR